jgi:putative methionine-R-sulfoxide reductase with GAF domain
MQRVTDAALAHLALDDLLAELLERIADILGADTAAFLLLDEDARELIARAAKGIEEEVEQGVRIPLGRGFAGRIAAERRPVILPDVERADIYNPILREKGIRSLLGVPLLVEGSVTGVLHVGTLTLREFTDEDRTLLALAGDRAAWTSLDGAGNTELDVGVYTLSARNPTPRKVREMAMTREEFGPDPSPPPIAGRGNTLVYYRHEDGILGDPTHTVERVLGSHAKRIFRADDPMALAADRGRVASLQRELYRGDACNCDADPVFSPDGTKLAYIQVKNCCVDEETADVYVESSDGGGRTPVTTDTKPKFGVAWSPDSKQLAYGYYNSGFRLAVVNADGTGAHDVATGENPSWSPDGTQLAYDDSKFHVFVANADGSNARQIADGEKPAWSPDGTRIAFDEKGDAFTMRPDGSDRRSVASGLTELGWSPDGTQVVGAARAGILVVPAGGGNATQVPGTRRFDGNPSWSPDGARIVFDSLRNDLDRDAFAEPEIYQYWVNYKYTVPINFYNPDYVYSEADVHSNYGRTLSKGQFYGNPLGIALSGKYTAVLTQPPDSSQKQLWVLGAKGGYRLIRLPSRSTGPISASNGRLVFLAGRTIRVVDLKTSKQRLVAFARGPIAGVAISGRRVSWAVNIAGRGLIRSVMLPKH